MKSETKTAKLAKYLISLGWKVITEYSGTRYDSPMTQSGYWVTIVIEGRAVRTITPLPLHYPIRGIGNAYAYAKSAQ